ncbi:hypothetical protein I1A_001661 [Pseudomonas fluorescens R124]|uniref:Uncharacterized protein n=1 Tax=Pseudomonas fluorescens R124 TaxID=743713 RepID=A0A7U9GRC2_PSEFL|nr:hypothetical protein I1A_001661 [Pseudomonas fluorescens R124]
MVRGEMLISPRLMKFWIWKVLTSLFPKALLKYLKLNLRMSEMEVIQFHSLR